ncbi:MAG TPA: BTAD domain-containing putative transcriptional regulator [Pseudonocardiaceae bacterium]|nr:BTAD domain-containing putative transcriptional regulator [Pseudonocardiaceae bacterium]
MTRARAQRLVPGDRSMQWRALGPVEAVVAGRPADLGPPRQRALFALLLSRVDRPVAIDAVIEDLWSGDPPAAAMTSLRAYVSNLRRVLEPDRPPRAPATVLRTRAPGYVLDSRGVDVDVRRFAEHVAAGRVALSRGNSTRAVAEFEAALGLWRGKAYADVADAGWAAPEVARLEELRLSVVEARCAAQLQLGEHHSAVAELEMHVRAHPLREHGCELLALALYRAGRQAEALGVLRVTRARLAEDLGIDPGAVLQRLEQNILTHALALDWHPPTSTPTTILAERSAAAPSATTPVQPRADPSAEEFGMRASQRVVSTQVQSLSEVIGRHGELATLRAAFTDPARQQRPVMRVLTGLGGVGKTSLARAYAQRYLAHYGLVWWVRAEDPEAVPGEFRALLDIVAPQYAEHAHDPVQAVHAVLANRAGSWLLVIDNIAEPEALRGMLPAAGNGDVLVTSRAGTWPDRQMVLPVQPLAASHAVQLVTALSGDADQDSAAILSDELGGLPLALAQAACYVAHSALDLTGYLSLYRSRRAELHQQGHAPDYPATVATTWQLAFDQLSTPAQALLNVLAWYAPDTIPLDRLLTCDTDRLRLPDPANCPLRPLLTDALHRHRAISELISYGLLTRVGSGGSVTVHRLVQAVTADRLTAEGNHSGWIGTAAALLNAACPPWAGSQVTITSMPDMRTMQTLHTHVRTLIEHLRPDQPITLNLRHTLIEWAGLTGDSVRARSLCAALVADSERILGSDDPATAIARSSLARWTGKTGDVVRARALAATVVENMMQVLGPNDRHTLLARINLARWTGEAGHAEQARELAAAVVEDAQRVLGPDDRYTLVARATLAHWIGEAGDAIGAWKSAAAVVEDAQRVLGADDRYTLVTRSDLARWVWKAGDATGARELAAALVEDHERVLGAEHRYTLLARANLARWTGEAGDLERAKKLAAAVLGDFVRLYGPDHRYTLVAHSWLAPWAPQSVEH